MPDRRSWGTKKRWAESVSDRTANTRNTRRAFHFSSRGQHATGTTADNLTGLRFSANRAQDAPVPGPVVRSGKDQGKVSAVATCLTQGRLGRFLGGLFGVVLF